MGIILLLLLLVLLIWGGVKIIRNNRWPREAIIGKVYHFVASTESRQSRRSSKTYVVWRFSLERYDRAGNALPLIPIEMRGQRMKGILEEGNEVELLGKPRRRRVYSPKRVYNHTLGSFVKVRSDWSF